MTRPSTIETPAHIAELRSVLRHEPFSAHRKRYHLGTYDTLAEARAARVAGEILLHKYEVKL